MNLLVYHQLKVSHIDLIPIYQLLNLDNVTGDEPKTKKKVKKKVKKTGPPDLSIFDENSPSIFDDPLNALGTS